MSGGEGGRTGKRRVGGGGTEGISKKAGDRRRVRKGDLWSVSHLCGLFLTCVWSVSHL